jgi:hypothetical protein
VRPALAASTRSTSPGERSIGPIVRESSAANGASTASPPRTSGRSRRRGSPLVTGAGCVATGAARVLGAASLIRPLPLRRRSPRATPTGGAQPCPCAARREESPASSARISMSPIPRD